MVTFYRDDSSNDPNEDDSQYKAEEWYFADGTCVTDKGEYQGAIQLTKLTPQQPKLAPYEFGFVDIALPDHDLPKARAVVHEFRMFVLMAPKLAPMRVCLSSSFLTERSGQPGCTLRVQFVAIAHE